MTYNTRIVKDITELNKVLKFCYQILGECNDDVYDIYGPDAWANRLNQNYLMVFAEADGDIWKTMHGNMATNISHSVQQMRPMDSMKNVDISLHFHL